MPEFRHKTIPPPTVSLVNVLGYSAVFFMTFAE
jgi:hypothetical protein